MPSITNNISFFPFGKIIRLFCDLFIFDLLYNVKHTHNKRMEPFSAFAQVNKLIVVYKMLLHGSSTKMLTLINGGMLALSKAGGKREEKRRKSAEASVQQLHVRWEHAFFPHHPKDLCRLGHRGSS